MKILYINAMGPTQRAPLGGIFVSQRIRALRKLGVEICPVNVRISNSAVVNMLLRLKNIKETGKPVSRQLDVEYKIMEAKMDLYHTFRAGKDCAAYDKVLIRDIYGGLDQYKEADLIHLHWCWPVGRIVSKLAGERKIPYVLTFHGSDINVCLGIPAIKHELLKIMENAASVEFVSNALLQTALKAGYSGKNAVVIYNGIDTDVFYLNRVDKEAKCVGFVGNLIPVKGADRLPAIFSEIRKKYTGEVRFFITGSGELERAIKDQAKALDLQIAFTGQLAPDILRKVYNRLDILVVPSRNEGYSCAIKEAQSCGAIPVANNVGGIKEAVGDYGSVVTADDEAELVGLFAKRVVEYLDKKPDENFMNAMVQSARECSWVEMQKKSLENYKRIVNK